MDGNNIIEGPTCSLYMESRDIVCGDFGSEASSGVVKISETDGVMGLSSVCCDGDHPVMLRMPPLRGRGMEGHKRYMKP